LGSTTGMGGGFYGRFGSLVWLANRLTPAGLSF
jgi:hypothetical protein